MKQYLFFPIISLIFLSLVGTVMSQISTTTTSITTTPSSSGSSSNSGSGAMVISEIVTRIKITTIKVFQSIKIGQSPIGSAKSLTSITTSQMQKTTGFFVLSNSTIIAIIILVVALCLIIILYLFRKFYIPKVAKK